MNGVTKTSTKSSFIHLTRKIELPHCYKDVLDIPGANRLNQTGEWWKTQQASVLHCSDRWFDRPGCDETTISMDLSDVIITHYPNNVISQLGSAGTFYHTQAGCNTKLKWLITSGYIQSIDKLFIFRCFEFAMSDDCLPDNRDCLRIIPNLRFVSWHSKFRVFYVRATPRMSKTRIHVIRECSWCVHVRQNQGSV